MVGIPVWQLWTKEMIAAGKVAHSLITSDEAKHNNDPLLLIQSQTAVTKHVGENWMINRRESGEVDALMATIMAIYVSSRAQNAEIGVF